MDLLIRILGMSLSNPIAGQLARRQADASSKRDATFRTEPFPDGHLSAKSSLRCVVRDEHTRAVYPRK